MRDFLWNLSERSFNPGRTGFIRPRVPSMFEPANYLMAGPDTAQRNEGTGGNNYSSGSDAVEKADTTRQALEKHTIRNGKDHRNIRNIGRVAGPPPDSDSELQAASSIVQRTERLNTKISTSSDSQACERQHLNFVSPRVKKEGAQFKEELSVVASKDGVPSLPDTPRMGPHIRTEPEKDLREGEKPLAAEKGAGETPMEFPSQRAVNGGADSQPAPVREQMEEYNSISPLPIKPSTYAVRQTDKPDISIAKKPAPTIQVTIGRIEVRAVAAQIPSRPRRTSPSMSLDDYLLHRRGSER